MNRLYTVLALVSLLGPSVHAEVQPPPSQKVACLSDDQVQVKGKTKLLKTFTMDYWSIAGKEVLKLPVPLQKKGFVIGDFHFNNVGIYYDYSISRSELIINDLDDAGNNFLVADFFKYLTYVQKVDKTVDQNGLLQNYIRGLKRQKSKTPAEIENLLSKNQYAFTSAYLKYIANKRAEFEKFDKNSLSPAQKNTVQLLQQLKVIKRLSNVDYLVQVNDSGSSANMERYEFIGTDSNGAVGMIEFKSLKCSATGNEKEQDLNAGFTYAKKFFSDNFPSSSTANQFVYQMGTQSFLVREKRNNPLKKLDIEKSTPAEFSSYANYFANYLGLIHARSADAAYIESAVANSAAIITTAKSISKAFKDKVKD